MSNKLIAAVWLIGVAIAATLAWWNPSKARINNLIDRATEIVCCVGCVVLAVGFVTSIVVAVGVLVSW